MHLERCIPDVRHWRWLLILLNVAAIFCLRLSNVAKEGEHIHDWLFYQQYHSANTCSNGRKMKTQNIFANDGIV